MVADRRWHLVTANDAALDLLTEGAPRELLASPANAPRISLHPDGVAPRIVNFTEWPEHILRRLDRQIAISADSDTVAELSIESFFPADAAIKLVGVG